MRYVLDASVGVKWVINEVDTPAALRVRDDFRNAVHELIAPDSYVLETAHGLTKAERRGAVLGAERLWTDLMLDCPQLHPFRPLMTRAIQLARQARIAVYDCLYVALAEQEGCEVLTADDRMKRSLPGSPIVLLASLPCSRNPAGWAASPPSDPHPGRWACRPD
jgi:predicted nucleic acid-binding protein